MANRGDGVIERALGLREHERPLGRRAQLVPRLTLSVTVRPIDARRGAMDDHHHHSSTLATPAAQRYPARGTTSSSASKNTRHGAQGAPRSSCATQHFHARDARMASVRETATATAQEQQQRMGGSERVQLASGNDLHELFCFLPEGAPRDGFAIHALRPPQDIGSRAI